MKYFRHITLLLLLLATLPAVASHIVGGDFTYRYIGRVGTDSIRYEVSLVLYEDCLNGEPQAIQEDNPAFIGVFNATGRRTAVYIDTNVNYKIQTVVPINFNNSCVSNIPNVCLLSKLFVDSFVVPANHNGYVVAYQRCCRNGQIMNIVSPGDKGATYFCEIPATTIATTNSSAVFRNYPPQIICRNNPLNYDYSAIDPDGDSLTYSFGPALLGAGPNSSGPNSIKPIPSPPPYDSVTYLPSYSAYKPMIGFPPIQINPTTGQLSGTPSQLGRFLVTVYCYEWRKGKMINKTRREFQFVVTDCTKKVIACIPQYSTDVNTYVVECTDFNVMFDNCSSGGFAYHWDFGVEGISNDTSNEFQPSFRYPDTGIYVVRLWVNPGTTCPDSISRFVKIFPVFRADYADSGLLCPGNPISFNDRSSTTIKPITSWFWSFGDGTTSDVQNPQHTYSVGGTYNVMLVSENVKNCVDTVLKQVIIDNFTPFAGQDTVIVKNETIHFNGRGGNQFTWSPAIYLDNPNISDPTGFYPDTGTFYYTVKVKNSYGCSGYDSIKVVVVNEAYFLLPSAFTPNGDGKNDLYRPISAGYSEIKTFKIYNRWGEVVYSSNLMYGGWDGTYKNKPAELGTYYWQINFIDRYGKEASLKGDVTLVR